jgi:hypothetical protein
MEKFYQSADLTRAIARPAVSDMDLLTLHVGGTPGLAEPAA